MPAGVLAPYHSPDGLLVPPHASRALPLFQPGSLSYPSPIAPFNPGVGGRTPRGSWSPPCLLSLSFPDFKLFFFLFSSSPPMPRCSFWMFSLVPLAGHSPGCAGGGAPRCLSVSQMKGWVVPGVFVLAPGARERGACSELPRAVGREARGGVELGSGEVLASRVLRRQTAVNMGFAGAGPADELSPS